MEGRLSKYFGTRNDSSGNPLYWDQPGNFPFRGTPPTMMKSDEMDQVPLVYDAKSALLELPADQEKYDQIIDHCANGWYQLRHEKFLENKEKPGTLSVFLSWLEVYGELPTSKSAWEAMKNDNKR